MINSFPGFRLQASGFRLQASGSGFRDWLILHKCEHEAYYYYEHGSSHVYVHVNLF
jgi:hypothetical protein